MNPLDGLAYGFSVALTPENLLAAMGGALLGTAVGILPGLGPTMVMAMLLGPTMALKPETGLIMLGAIYYGTQYGDSMTAILMNVPSEAPSAVIAADGYQMTKRGRAGPALSVAAIGAFIGSNLGLVGLILVAIPLSSFALTFGPREYFVLSLVGLLTLAFMQRGSTWGALVSLALGLMVTTVGLDEVSAVRRFTFGNTDIAAGIDTLPVIMGMVGLAEMIDTIATRSGLPKAAGLKIRELFPSPGEWRAAIPASLRGAGLGFLMGMLPGGGQTLCTVVSYNLERKLAPDEVGKGAVQAVAGPKSADDGSVTGHLVPMLVLGLPFSPAPAMLLAGLMMHGVQAGPMLIGQHPEIFWGLVAAMYIGNLALVVLNIPLVGLWASLLRLPQSVLSALVILIIMLGAFTLENQVFDIVVVLVSGLVGYVLGQLKFDRIMVLLGLIFGPLLERYLRQALIIAHGDPGAFFNGTIDLVLWAVFLVVLMGPVFWGWGRRRRLAGRAEEAIV